MKNLKNTWPINQSARQAKGITLVALIITVIVLLILAMVSIRLVMNGGIIDRAERGTAEYSVAEEKEQIQLGYNEYQMAQFEGGNAQLTVEGATVTAKTGGGWTVAFSSGRTYEVAADGTITGGTTANSGSGGNGTGEFSVASLPTATPGTEVSTNSKYESNSKTAVIPAGYTISNETNEQSIDTGLVIKKDGNEWVWIPVSSSDLTAMYTEDTTGWIMSGTEVVTKYKSNSEIISGKTRGNPGTTSWREPDVLNSDNYDNNTTNLSDAGLGANIEEAATKFRDDYKAMIDSVKKYGGFYVGRYELSNAGTQKNQASLTNTNWYNLYAKCKTLGSDSTEARMIWGCQWDQVCKFIETAVDANGETISLTDSRKYGNYKNSQAPANTGNYEISENNAVKKNTGSNEAWKTNNIYDLAGNCEEWTQETGTTALRSNRGGSYKSNGGVNGNIVTYRGNDRNPTSHTINLTSRSVLYIK